MSAGDRRKGKWSPVIVAKFGSSVLTTEPDRRRCIAELARLVSGGTRVVAILSALPGVTDELLALSRRAHRRPPVQMVARLLATGEWSSSLLFALAAKAEGIRTFVPEEGDFCITTCGHDLDASPVTLKMDWLLRAPRGAQLLVVPGFIGRNAKGAATLLGRGGSDLSALFIANTLGSVPCYLYKDVNGLFDRDPNTSEGTPLRFSRANWNDVILLGRRLVQPKAVRFARAHSQTFVIRKPGGTGTVVGPGGSVLELAAG